MKNVIRTSSRQCFATISSRLLPMLILLNISTAVQADETDAKRLLKAMSDYMTSQTALSFNYDATWEVVTTENQILGIASSGSLTLNRPDKMFSTRQGGFANAEMFFDGKTLTLFGKNLNIFTQVDLPGTVDHLINELKDTYQRPLPAADLLLSNAYDALLANVVDVKDLGSGYVGGKECDSLAFRTDEVDWQIWIAQGDKPYPCRYVITSRHAGNGLQYRIQVDDWKSGTDVETVEFSFENTTGAEQVEIENLQSGEGLPENFELKKEESQ